MIRSLQLEDIEQIKKIHEKFYKEEFKLPDFLDKFLCVFTVVENGDIVSVGGVRSIIESVVITNKDKSVKSRRSALYEILQASMFTAARFDYDQLHATVINDDKWKKHLMNIGFKPVKGEMLVLGV